MDIVFICGLEIDTVIGVHDWERRVRQTVVLDLELAADIGAAAATDSLVDALDYQAIGDRLVEFVGGSQFRLVETLAERCAALLTGEFGISWLRLRLAKPGALPGARAVGVVIERGERPADITLGNP